MSLPIRGYHTNGYRFAIDFILFNFVNQVNFAAFRLHHCISGSLGVLVYDVHIFLVIRDTPLQLVLDIRTKNLSPEKMPPRQMWDLYLYGMELWLLASFTIDKQTCIYTSYFTQRTQSSSSLYQRYFSTDKGDEEMSSSTVRKRMAHIWSGTRPLLWTGNQVEVIYLPLLCTKSICYKVQYNSYCAVSRKGYRRQPLFSTIWWLPQYEICTTRQLSDNNVVKTSGCRGCQFEGYDWIDREVWVNGQPESLGFIGSHCTR